MSEKYQTVVDAVYLGAAKVLSGSNQLLKSSDVKELFRVFLVDSEFHEKIDFKIKDSEGNDLFSIQASPSLISFFDIFGIKNGKKAIGVKFSELLQDPKSALNMLSKTPSLKDINFEAYEDIVFSLYQLHAKIQKKDKLKLSFKESYDIEVSNKRLEEMKIFYEHYESLKQDLLSSFSETIKQCESLYSSEGTFAVNWLSGDNKRPAILADITDALNGKIKKLDQRLWDSVKLRFIREDPLIESLRPNEEVAGKITGPTTGNLSTTRQYSKPTFKVFYGPPGTGKTREASSRVGLNKHWYKIVQIHPSSSYEDLIEGIKPVTFPNGDVKYEVQDGPVKIMAKKAGDKWVKSIVSARYFKGDDSKYILLNFPVGTVAKWFSPDEEFSCRTLAGEEIVSAHLAIADTLKIDINDDNQVVWQNLGFTFNPDWDLEEQFIQIEFKGSKWGGLDYVLVLDEMNRGNVAAILGELIFAISEARGSHNDKKAVSLQYSHEQFEWPINLSLYGTMNSTDVSLDRIDQAIKRRFDFQIVEPDPSLLKIDGLDLGLDSYLQELNNELSRAGAENGAYNVKDKLIGHSYFLPLCENARGISQEKQLKAFLGRELKKLWECQILPSLLSVFNGSRDDLDVFVENKLKKFAPNAANSTIYGWPFNEPIELVVNDRAS